MKKQIQQHESGRSMIEMVGVLAIMGLITAAAFALIQSAMTSQRVSKVSDEIDVLASHARALAVECGNFASLPDIEDITLGTTKEPKAVTLPRRILGKKTSEKIFETGDYYLYKDSNSDKKFVIKISPISTDDCEMMKYRAYGDGATADCTVDEESAITSLEITYTK